MHIKNLLTPERCLAKHTCSSKKRLLEKLAELIAQNTPGISAELLFTQLINRERLGSTGVGEGIAIPHCRFDTQGATLGALITLAEPIDFDAVDNQPVDVVFAMLVPTDANEQHLLTLASLAEALQSQHYVEGLRQSTDNTGLFLAAAGT
ncbi:MAG: IIA-like nitrogen-regulatory protein PtsN [Pseudomonadota bacterium]|jgi:PTS system nitrogen regulatory IIA component